MDSNDFCAKIQNIFLLWDFFAIFEKKCIVMAEIDNQKAAEYREQAIRYYEGEDVEVDLQRSAYYFSKAAEMGDAHSMYCMGLNYIDGTGVPRDVEKGINWLRKAAENGRQAGL